MDEWFEVLDVGGVPAVDREGRRDVVEVQALLSTTRSGAGVLLESEGSVLRLTATDARDLATSLLAAAHVLEHDLARH